jgi:hypothetical protein
MLGMTTTPRILIFLTEYHEAPSTETTLALRPKQESNTTEVMRN